MDDTNLIPTASVAAPAPAFPARSEPARPENVPDKFWDAIAGTIRTEALLKSYLELERKVAAMLPIPADDTDTAARERILAVLGRPAKPDEYAIEIDVDGIPGPDPEINTRLFDAGFTQAQAQLVYDLARERLKPLIDEAVAAVERRAMGDRLAARFGGPEAWKQTARQLRAWGEANLDAETFQALASSVEGIVAMHTMMQAKEPSLIDGREPAPAPMGEDELRTMMRDPRYWRDREPEFVKRVTRGFQKLYPE